MKRTNRIGGGRSFPSTTPFDFAQDKLRTGIMSPSCSDQEGQALIRLYQRAAFRVKQESGFLFSTLL
jgi:hypothetical protein